MLCTIITLAAYCSGTGPTRTFDRAQRTAAAFSDFSCSLVSAALGGSSFSMSTTTTDDDDAAVPLPRPFDCAAASSRSPTRVFDHFLYLTTSFRTKYVSPVMAAITPC